MLHNFRTERQERLESNRPRLLHSLRLPRSQSSGPEIRKDTEMVRHVGTYSLLERPGQTSYFSRQGRLFPRHSLYRQLRTIYEHFILSPLFRPRPAPRRDRWGKGDPDRGTIPYLQPHGFTVRRLGRGREGRSLIKKKIQRQGRRSRGLVVSKGF